MGDNSTKRDIVMGDNSTVDMRKLEQWRLTGKVWRVYITIIQKCGMDRTTEATTLDYYWH